MLAIHNLRTLTAGAFRVGRAIVLLSCLLAPALAQSPEEPSQDSQPITLDRIVAVVNRQAILFSDIEDEFRIVVLDPARTDQSQMTPQEALQRLISRTLIRQQMQQEDIPTAKPTPEEISSREKEIRSELPVCVRENCKSDAAWKAFLTAHDLTPEHVDDYLRNRLEILRFIEMRFRLGIRIAPEEVEAYYREKLVPLYPPGQNAPPLEKVAPRIEEILLQQQVNILFEDWLSNLQKQGEIEILDPSLEPAKTTDQGFAATSPNRQTNQESGLPAPSVGVRPVNPGEGSE
jgi:hypothetical protein